MRRTTWGIALCAAAVAMAGTALRSAERETPVLLAQAEDTSAKPERTTSTAAAPAKKLTGRLPPGYGKLGVSDEQRQKIYAIQHRYEQQITELEKQIEALEARVDEESQAVLTTAQKARLKEVRDAARKRRTSSRSSSTGRAAEE